LKGKMTVQTKITAGPVIRKIADQEDGAIFSGSLPSPQERRATGKALRDKILHESHATQGHGQESSRTVRWLQR
jgi:hypothetical protein